MFFKSKIADFFARMLAGLALGVLFGWLLSSLSYQLSDDKTTVREPQTVEIVIPYGTDSQIQHGSYVPTIPDSMTFVQDDILRVRNEDTVAHQLGPLFIPAGTSSALKLDTANSYSYSCSFEPKKSFGLNVLPRVTPGLQFQGILAIGLPSGMMLGVYSYMIPTRKKGATGEKAAVPTQL